MNSEITSAPAHVAAPPATGIVGLHHVSIVARDLARTVDFYERILGQLELGRAPVPVAEPGRPGHVRETDALWFGNRAGSVGTLIAAVERPNAPQGAPGIGAHGPTSHQRVRSTRGTASSSAHRSASTGPIQTAYS